MTYSETIKKQDVCDTRRRFIQRSMTYLDKIFDLKFSDEIEFIHDVLMKGDYYN